MENGRLLNLGALVLGIATIAGCSDAIPVQQLSDMYPAGLPIRTADRIDANGSPAYVLNLTDNKYDPEVARKAYEYFEEVGKLNAKFDYKIGNNNRILVVNPQKADARATFIVPPHSPRPLRWDRQLDMYPGVTELDSAPGRDEVKRTFSIVESVQNRENSLFSTSSGETTEAFATEVCQQMLQVEVHSLDGKVIASEQNIGQEVVCNSIGFFLAYRYMGYPYESYKKFMDTNPILKLPYGGDQRFLVFNRNGYDSLPTPGAILK